MKKLAIFAVLACLALSPTQQAQLRIVLQELPESVVDGGTPAIVAYLNAPVLVTPATWTNNAHFIQAAVVVTNTQGEAEAMLVTRTNSVRVLLQPATYRNRLPFSVKGEDIESLQRQP